MSGDDRRELREQLLRNARQMRREAEKTIDRQWARTLVAMAGRMTRAANQLASGEIAPMELSGSAA